MSQHKGKEEMNMLDEIMYVTSEGHCKMQLVHDYLQRFDVKDNRLLAPLKDIHKVLCIIEHIVDDHQDKGVQDEYN